MRWTPVCLNILLTLGFALSTLSIGLISLPASALEIKSAWTENFTPVLEINCQSTTRNQDYQDFSPLCQEICASPSMCLIEEGLCYNCSSSESWISTRFPLEINSWKTESLVLEDMVHPLSQLLQNSFIVLDSYSLYNFIDAWRSPLWQSMLQAFCPEPELTDTLTASSHLLSPLLLLPWSTPFALSETFVYCPNSSSKIHRLMRRANDLPSTHTQ